MDDGWSALRKPHWGVAGGVGGLLVGVLAAAATAPMPLFPAIVALALVLALAVGQSLAASLPGAIKNVWRIAAGTVFAGLVLAAMVPVAIWQRNREIAADSSETAPAQPQRQMPLVDSFLTTVFLDRKAGQPQHVAPPGRLQREMASIEMMRAAAMLSERKVKLPDSPSASTTALVEYALVLELSARFRERWAVRLLDAVGSGGSSSVQSSKVFKDQEHHDHIDLDRLGHLSQVNPTT
jgi:hypothetical protein